MAKKIVDQVQDLEITNYAQVLVDIKGRVQRAQVKAALAANKELLLLYWDIGKMLAEKIEAAGWGTKIVDRLSQDLQRDFPGIKGFSRENIYRMIGFYQAYAIVAQPVLLLDSVIVSQSATQLESLPIFNIPWFHNVVLIIKVKNNEERIWYAKKTIENSWSRAALEAQIKSNAYGRQGKAITNFSRTLPAPHSGLAQDTLKDPYVFDFLTLHEDHLELDLERGLIVHVEKLLLEMGKGFAFIERQYHLVVAEQDFYIDLLFYHYKLRCFVVVELKSRAFKPEDAGQLNFYLSAVDDLVKSEFDNPTIGLLLCKTKNDVMVEYALRRSSSPIGVAGYEVDLLDKLPKDLQSSLPTIEEFEAEFAKQEALEVIAKKQNLK
ncbi:MAG: PDDEXK nuclease domain-containing protein [Candidatus Chromulinivorax sp.]|nr:PDDEXK nuclease domain-containing protein [Candidatus Chromulinivorax sp.]